MKKFSDFTWIFRYLLVSICGFYLRKKIFLKKVLKEANQTWFNFSDKTFNSLCSNLCGEIPERYTNIKDLWLTTFDFFVNDACEREQKQHPNRSIIPVDILEIVEIKPETYKVNIIKCGDRNKKKSRNKEYSILKSYTVTVTRAEVEEELWK